MVQEFFEFFGHLLFLTLFDLVLVFLNGYLFDLFFPDIELYKVILTNYLGYHVNKSNCLILFNRKKAKIQLVVKCTNVINYVPTLIFR